MTDAEKTERFTNRTLTPLQVVGEIIGFLFAVGVFALAIFA